MRTPTRTIAPNLKDRINFITRTIKRLGVCTIDNGKLTSAEVSALSEHFTVEREMGYTKFRPL